MAPEAFTVNSTRTARRIDPFATFKFHVEIDGIKEAAFSECSGMEMTTDVFEYQENMPTSCPAG
jgi:hypothetical protein